MLSEGGGALGAIRVGVAGWDYPDWRGTVYPSRPPGGFDRLAYLARFVDCVEVDSTFYRPADPRRAASWPRRTEGKPGFRFTAKAHRSLTHEPGAAPRSAVRAVLAGLAPLREAGVFGALLLQFPHSFRLSPASLERIERLLGLLAGWPAVVEVRHASWADPEVPGWFRARGAGLAAVDQPRLRGSTIEATFAAAGPVAYLRLHGRNAAAWFREGAGRDARYDWYYTEEELEPLAASARRAAAATSEAFVIQNNHFRGQALANALMMKRLLGEDLPEAPAELVNAFPDLRRFTRPRGDLLF